MEDIINWVELSRKLAGNETGISRNRIPKKYQSKINSLIQHLEEWENELNKPITNSQRTTVWVWCRCDLTAQI